MDKCDNTKNSMIQLCAYDFDKTLVPYDSYNRYLKHLFVLRPITIGVLLLLRKMRIMSSKSLKKKVTDIVSRSERLTRDAHWYANKIVYDIQVPQINGNSLLIISASPKIYMQYIAEHLQCQLICSDYIDNQYVEMYGEVKAKYLYQYYPMSEYEYVYAMSDSESDMCWMKEFKQYEIIE
jgi:HAD superfamily phosphoserine phosphatase-like hydrolase